MRGLVHLLVIVLVVPTLAFVAATDVAEPDCPIVDVAFVGPACVVPGGYLMFASDGSAQFTHGPDPMPTVLPAVGVAVGATLPGVEPTCVTDPAEPAIRLIVARASRAADRSATLVPLARDSVLNANAIVLAEAMKFGADIRLRVRCDASGEIEVNVVELATPPGAITFWGTAEDLRAQGFGDSLNKEWVLLDSSYDACNCGGMSQFWHDDRPDAGNYNNRGGQFSITFVRNYGTGDQVVAAFREVMLHELGHSLGAVQSSSPNSSGGAHCNDGGDVMCYSDGGPTSMYEDSVCISPGSPGFSRVFDCNNNDYFHPSPAAGSYLATHWNLASGVSVWLTRAPFELP